MSADPSPSKQLASRFAHLAYSPPKKGPNPFSRSTSFTRPQVDRLGSDVDSDDLDGEDPATNEQPTIADQDLRPNQVKEEVELDFHVPKGQASPYFPPPLKRKLSSSSPLTSPPSSDAPSPKKKSSVPIARKYADPSKYADGHPVITDLMRYDADCMFVGINPGLSSAKKGHHYAGATNRFWNCLYQSGFTPRLLSPTEDHTLPTEHSICMTNLVPRPTASASELSPSLDHRPNVPLLLSKIATYRPRAVCFVGKDIWKEVEYVLKKAHAGLEGRGRAGGKEKGKGKGKGKERAEEVGTRWEGPRGWKMVHQKVKNEEEGDGVTDGDDGEGERVEETYFWVVSSTSGLVRDSMATRLTTQWSPLLSFIQDLKAGVRPWLAPSPATSHSSNSNEREFRAIDLGKVQRTVGEMIRVRDEKKGAGKGVKEEDGNRQEEGGGEGGGWEVTEVWEPGMKEGVR